MQPFAGPDRQRSRSARIRDAFVQLGIAFLFASSAWDLRLNSVLTVLGVVVVVYLVLCALAAIYWARVRRAEHRPFQKRSAQQVGGSERVPAPLWDREIDG